METPNKNASRPLLVPGKFYRAMNHYAWCCYKVTASNEPHCKAYCVRVEDGRIEYFYIDGRYDSDGKSEHTLIDELYT